MTQSANALVKRRKGSLSLYISILLALTATIPLIVAIGSIELLLRPALVSQVSEGDGERCTNPRSVNRCVFN